MKTLTIIFLGLLCAWTSIDPSDLEIGHVEGAMIDVRDSLQFEGLCGGTERIEVQFEKIRFCDQKNKLKIKGQVTTFYDEPFPNCGIVAGREEQGGIKANSDVLTTDSLGRFDVTIDYRPDDELFIFGLGTTIIKTKIKKGKTGEEAGS